MCSEISTRLLKPALEGLSTASVKDAYFSKATQSTNVKTNRQCTIKSSKNLSTQVEKIIYNDPICYRHMINVAKLLNVSTRTLLRRLEADGTNFKKVRDQALFRRAIDELTLENMSATEVASHLAFSDPAHFTRAFTRWSGTTPCAFKDKNR